MIRKIFIFLIFLMFSSCTEYVLIYNSEITTAMGIKQLRIEYGISGLNQGVYKLKLYDVKLYEEKNK